MLEDNAASLLRDSAPITADTGRGYGAHTGPNGFTVLSELSILTLPLPVLVGFITVP